ncbi:MAG: amidohydrolase family protein [Gracilimonas sp.]|uniref:amidohydrolase family protein n=1 Tax=Gracilimonas sp. TaxID=1974203 RepID=UPI003750F6ED|nr:amidohydrolase family protein [Gracilimonas sp.]
MKPFCFLIFVLLATLQGLAQERPPIIDMHMHALAADQQGPPPVAICSPFNQFPAWDPAQPYGELWLDILKNPPCSDPIWSPKTDSELMNRSLEIMKKYNVIGVLSGTPDRVKIWMNAAPNRFYAGVGFQLEPNSYSPDSIRALHVAGQLDVFAEITNQYIGIDPSDERMEPYWQLAEELDIPVGIHIGTGPPGVIYLGATGYRARLHSPLSIEEVLVKHPKLRVYIMHAGYPMLDDMLAVLYAHPQVYVELGVIIFTQPKKAFYRYLETMVDAGFGNRIMFGSDQMVWPEAIVRSIDTINKAPFLTEKHKRDILYNNAARFLRLSKAEISRHLDM